MTTQPNRPQNRAKAKRTLMRGADGRLRPASGETEIGDVWEQQRRLQLKQAIDDQRKRATLQRLRRERGLIGYSLSQTKRLLHQAKASLFGSVSSAPTAAVTKPTAPTPPSPSATAKSVEIVISMPSLRRIPVGRNIRKTVRRFSTGFKTSSRRKTLVATALAVCIIIASAGYFLRPAASSPDSPPRADVKGTASGTAIALQKGTPTYDTLLPAGKSIESLGGWTRVSPPDRNPVYAYVDNIGSVRISVSQQPLPPEFGKDTERQVKELASGYGADQTFAAGKTTIHIGTSVKGPQSVIFNRNKTLVLIKSVAPIDNGQWVSYIDSLQ